VYLRNDPELNQNGTTRTALNKGRFDYGLSLGPDFRVVVMNIDS
jgi:hypothetical protein